MTDGSGERKTTGSGLPIWAAAVRWEEVAFFFRPLNPGSCLTVG